jgi:glucokinase
LLAGAGIGVVDVGGTTTRWAVLADAVEAEFDVTERPTGSGALAEMAEDFSDQCCRQVVLAVAGPVSAGRGELSNGLLSFDETALGRNWDRPVRIVNDLVAAAAGIAALPATAARWLYGAQRDGATWVVGLGTGVGAALALPLGDDVGVLGGEWGHSGMADEGSHGSVEDLLSGTGFASWARRELDDLRVLRAEDVLALPPASWEGVRGRYSHLLGQALGDLVLTVDAPGGVRLVGGFAQAIVEKIDRRAFEEGLLGGRRLTASLVDLPIAVVKGYPALLGALAFGERRATLLNDR